MPKLAIYVPKKEMKVVEKWRKRLDFSQIFVRALQPEIAERNSPTFEDPLVAAAAYYAESTPTDLVRAAGRQLATEQLLKCQLAKHDLQELLQLSGLEQVAERQLDTVLKLSGQDDKRAKLLKKNGFGDADTPTGERLFADLTGIRETWATIVNE